MRIREKIWAKPKVYAKQKVKEKQHCEVWVSCDAKRKLWTVRQNKKVNYDQNKTMNYEQNKNYERWAKKIVKRAKQTLRAKQNLW